jgi:hypothetical protein
MVEPTCSFGGRITDRAWARQASARRGVTRLGLSDLHGVLCGRHASAMPNLVTRGWTAGQNVGAYPANSLPPTRDGAPAAAAIETVVADAAGAATHVTLSADVPYVLFQASPYRAVRARIADSVSDTGRAVATGTTTSGSASVTSVTPTAGTVLVGQRVAGPGIPPNTRIKSYSAGTAVLTNKATASG